MTQAEALQEARRRRLFTDSPVEAERKQLPRGTGEWPGFSAVYAKLRFAAEQMGHSQIRGNDFHVKTMAVLGSGHEETMKSHLAFVRFYGWLESGEAAFADADRRERGDAV